LNEHGNTQVSPAQSIGNRAFFTEIRKRDDHTVNAFAITREKFRAQSRLFSGLDCTILALFTIQGHSIDVGCPKSPKHLVASAFG
jgi:hypothetical protein